MKTDAERIFVDTNVLLAATDQSRDTHAEALKFLESALAGCYRLFVSGQIFREYLVVATRPAAVNGLGLTPGEACSNLRKFGQVVQVLEETRETLERLIELTENYALHGKRIHDANVVATMQAHGLAHLKTENPEDFKVFPQIHFL